MDIGSGSAAGSNDQFDNVYAELSVLQHLSSWQGSVKVLDFARNDDQVGPLCNAT